MHPENLAPRAGASRSLAAAAALRKLPLGLSCALLVVAPLLCCSCAGDGAGSRSHAQSVSARAAVAAEDSATAAARAPNDAAEAGSINPENWPRGRWPLAHDAQLEARIDAVMALMTLEEKVAQTIQADIDYITPAELREYRLGSILAGGNSAPGQRYDATPAEWLALADAYWEAAMDATDGHQPIPILWGIDAVHGQSHVVGATLFPHNVGLGATRNPELLREIGRVTAIETRATGMDWTFAPTVAVPQDVRWGRSYEGYSESPQIVAPLAAAMVEGLQGKPGAVDFLGDTRLLATAKHFVGDGGTHDGQDQGDTSVSEAQLRDTHAAGYYSAIHAGVQSVMASYSSFHGEKLHGHHALLTGVLKERLGFGGFVVGDYNGHAQLPGASSRDGLPSYLAGLDMPMAPDGWKGMYENTLAHARSGALPLERLDDAVRRILRVKLRMGLFDAPKPSQRALGGRFDLLGAPQHRALAREAVRQSLVLLKNQDGLLPLKPQQHLLVAGDGADNVSKQSGGWTLTWQGTGVQPEDFPGATSIWQGLKAQVEAAGGSAELAIDGQWQRKPDVAIVVFGEEPYAEFAGDLDDLHFKGGRTDDLELIQALKAEGIPVVAVFLSGRPLWISREINAADAFVAAWLPGSEGAGIADVLLRRSNGRIQYDFRGRLSFSWPKVASHQSGHSAGDPSAAPLFPLGYGLRYRSR